MENARVLKNGECRSTTGFKLVVLSPDLELRPVSHAIYSGYTPDRGTFQVYENGDVIPYVRWNGKGPNYGIDSISEDGNRIPIPFNDAAEIWSALRKKYHWIDNYLEPQGRGDCFLPEIVEDEYLCNIQKRKRLTFFLTKFGFTPGFHPEFFMRDKKEDLNLSPRKLDFNPDEYIGEEKYWTGELVSICQFEEWYGSNGDGKGYVKLSHRPNYESGSNYAYQETVKREGEKGIEFWTGFRFLIRIQHGNHVSNHISFGHRIDVWKVR